MGSSAEGWKGAAAELAREVLLVATEEATARCPAPGSALLVLCCTLGSDGLKSNPSAERRRTVNTGRTHETSQLPL